jgi:hypothetical protein
MNVAAVSHHASRGNIFPFDPAQLYPSDANMVQRTYPILNERM